MIAESIKGDEISSQSVYIEEYDVAPKDEEEKGAMNMLIFSQLCLFH